MPDPQAPTNPNPGGDGGNPPAPNPAPAPGATPPAVEFDPSALSKDQINQILEKNPEIWKADRIAELREKAKKHDDAEAAKSAAEAKALEEEGKFKELSESQKARITELESQAKTGTINNSLITKLAPLGVVNLEDALKLIDRSKIEVDADGTVKGVDEAIEALKSEKQYLFNGTPTNPTVGTPTNPGNGGGSGEPKKFKASQLRGPEGTKFYNENREEILKAQAAGLIEQD